ncbi:putative Acid phosphatase [Medicago truncatula]|uniref:Putative Acid phosphatase n=1 Tax=Medicago truncatula TaxID=3880 RepID=A0A396GUP8_MEDTR|nr:putative Acid phosphatase [Medicago truncatula]
MAWCLKQRMLSPVIFPASVLLRLLSNHSSIAEKLPRFEHHLKPQQQSLNFLVVGDWGRKGNYNQSLVAHQMGIVGDNLNIDFVISTGDNFYKDGLEGVDDPTFYESFVNIYTAPSLQKIWYSVLGNHDYRGDVDAQLSSILRQKDSRWVCLRSFILDGGIVEFFFVDTTPFIEKYFTDPKEHTYDWNGVLPRESYRAELLKNVDLALVKSKAKWKIVVGHHTIKSVGHHGNTQELEQQLLPILKCFFFGLILCTCAYCNSVLHCVTALGSGSFLDLRAPVYLDFGSSGFSFCMSMVWFLFGPSDRNTSTDTCTDTTTFYLPLSVSFYDVTLVFTVSLEKSFSQKVKYAKLQKSFS